ADYKFLNVETGLTYSGGMMDMFISVLEIFCNMKDENKEKIQNAFDKGDWKNYTIFVHSLKSTSLSIGGEQLGQIAKELEAAGKILTDTDSSDADKLDAENFIKSHHADAMKIYDKLVEEGNLYLKNNS
ncbi:MAG: Hpt domain-containing protein, partial [Selenomonadaceae bacterium]|nr:Hpt domain-containing protein [Selenomonadaceae bacterium]